MKLSISENADPNYLAVVVNIPQITNHPNADRLEIVEIFGNSIIIGKGLYTTGDKVVYFPVESCIKPEFLTWANLLDNSNLNADGKTKGFFNAKHGRVKAVSLRSVPSQGFLYKVSELSRYYKTSEDDFKVGESFDTVGDDRLVTKYIRQTSNNSNESSLKKPKIPNWINDTMGYLPKPIRKVLYGPIKWWYMPSNEGGIKSQIVEGQFKFHYKTENLGKNIFVLNPDDDITCTSKWHGTSFCGGNILCKTNLSLLDKVARFIGIPVKEQEYKFVYTSRSVYKNRRDGKYTEDVWGIHAAELEHDVPEGIICYGEIVGYTPSNKMVQKNYDYGVAPGESELRIYRVVSVNEIGEFYEFTWDQIADFCKDNNLKTVHVYYNGKARDLFPEIVVGDNWNNEFLSKLKDKYLDKPCEFCTTGVVNEGIVVKINNRENKPVFKFKSPKFIIGESTSRDSGEENIDEEN